MRIHHTAPSRPKGATAGIPWATLPRDLQIRFTIECAEARTEALATFAAQTMLASAEPVPWAEDVLQMAEAILRDLESTR